jgi:trimeric autotransporter adhesin
MKRKILFLLGMLCLTTFASAQTIVDDAVQGTGSNQHNYVGSWVHGVNVSSFYKGTLSYSSVANAYVTLTFVGARAEWYTEKKSTHGIVAVSIDGRSETMVDLYSDTEQHSLVYVSPLLTYGTHIFKIRVTGTKNPASSNYYAIHDFLFFHGGTELPPSISNTATGNGALESYIPTDGGHHMGYNSAFGFHALNKVVASSQNTAIGAEALTSVDRAGQNTAVGYFAIRNGLSGQFGNTAVGAYTFNSINPGYENTTIGVNSGPVYETRLDNSTALGAWARTTASNQVRVGDSRVTSIGGQVSWSTLSDGRFKSDLREDVSGLEFVNKLRPVSYMVDKPAVEKFLGIPDSISSSRVASKERPIRQTGFVAQEVEALVKKSGYVFSGVDVPKNDKDPYTIRYAEFVVPLVKAVQELSAKNEEQQKQIDQLLTLLGKTEEGNSGMKSDETLLLQNNPNPFSVNTDIKMVLPETAGSANIIVYNLEGKQLKQLQVKGRGKVSTTILGNELSAGMYIYALIVDGKVVDTKRMILTK